DVAAMLRQSLEPLIAQAARDGIELRVVTLGVAATVPIDREKIAWCVATLVGNALRYVKKGEGENEAGGSVLVQVGSDETSPDLVTIAAQGGGAGLPKAQAPVLFRRRGGRMAGEGLPVGPGREIGAAAGGGGEVESRQGTDEHGTSIPLRLARRPSGHAKAR